MKRLYYFALLALITVTAMPIAAGPVISFSNVEYNFGQIYETGGRVTAYFIFQNDGDQDLEIRNVRSNCGCVTPEWETTVIAPHTNGKIAATYNPYGRPGRFQKSIRVLTNASDEPVVLYVKGEVLKVVLPCQEEANDTETQYGGFSYGEGQTPAQAKENAMRNAAETLAMKVFPDAAQINRVTTESNNSRSNKMVIENMATDEQKQFIYNNCSLQCYKILQKEDGTYQAYVAIKIARTEIQQYKQK